jgi:hypothetical protein
MAYDWSGARTRRIRLFKASAFVLVTAVAAVPLFLLALRLPDF